MKLKQENIEAFMELEARKALGISQDLLASMLNVNRAQISMMESRQERSLPSKANVLLLPIRENVMKCLLQMQAAKEKTIQLELDFQEALKKQLSKAENDLNNINFKLPHLEEKMDFYATQYQLIKTYIANMDVKKDPILFSALGDSLTEAKEQVEKLSYQLNVKLKFKKNQLELGIAWMKEQLNQLAKT